MVQLTQAYQTDQLPKPGGNVIQAGDYYAVISSTQVVLTKAGDGTFIEIEVVIVDDPVNNGHTIIERINNVNPSSDAVYRANGTIRAINESLNIQVLTDTDQWVGQPILITVGVEEADGGFPEKNRILAYKRVDNAVVVPQPAPVDQQPTAQPPIVPPVAPPAAVPPITAPPVAPPPMPQPGVAPVVPLQTAEPLAAPAQPVAPVTYATVPAQPAAVTPATPAAPYAPAAPAAPAAPGATLPDDLPF